jgi:hypothetical protein
MATQPTYACQRASRVRNQRSDRGCEGVDGDGGVRHESFRSGATGDRGGPRHPGGSPAEAESAKGIRPSLEGTAPSGEQVLVELSAVQAIVAAQATPKRRRRSASGWLVTSAQAAANAAKEGGFMGFGAAQVSKGEKEMLDQVRGAVSQA